MKADVKILPDHLLALALPPSNSLMAADCFVTNVTIFNTAVPLAGEVRPEPSITGSTANGPVP